MFKATDGKYKKVCLSALAKRVEREIEHGRSARRPISWNSAIEEFMTRCSRGSENRSGHPKSKQDQWREETVLRRLAKRFPGRPVHATAYADLRAYLNEREKQRARGKQTPYARATINREVAVITRFFNFLEAEEHVERNPARRLKQSKTSNCRSHMAPSMAELRVWRENIPPDRQEVMDFFDIAVCTGMRASEILGLRPEQYRSQERMLFLPCPKEQRPASIPLNSRAQAVVERRIAVGGEWLFQRPDGRHITVDQVRVVLSHALKSAGIARPYWVHDLRRAFATLAYAHSGLLEAQALLRHSSPIVTKRYIAVPDAALRETVSRMAADWDVEQSENKIRTSEVPSVTSQVATT